eukprot:Clim_evm3s108 gene=Clim_evmTU3s108
MADKVVAKDDPPVATEVGESSAADVADAAGKQELQQKLTELSLQDKHTYSDHSSQNGSRPASVKSGTARSPSKGGSSISPIGRRRWRSNQGIPPLISEKLQPVSFTWTHGGREVLLTGSFFNWTEFVRMEEVVNPADPTEYRYHYCVIELPAAIHLYKFKVDGEWLHAPDQQFQPDPQGNINNVLSVTLPSAPSSIPHSPTETRSWNDLQFGADGNPLSALKADHSSSGAPDSLADDHHHSRPASPPHGGKIGYNQFMLTGVEGRTYAHIKGADDNTRRALAERRMVFVMVGLPARGKSFISSKLSRFLRWMGYKAKVFNIGNYRRNQLGSFHNHDFFRADNPAGVAARNHLAVLAVEDMLNWVRNEGHIGILDGTNSNIERRTMLVDMFHDAEQTINISIKVVFLEVLCNDLNIINENIALKVKHSDDYKDIDPDQAETDFRERLAHYEANYQTVQDKAYSYIKIFNVGQEMVANRIKGFLPTKVLFYLMNLHIQSRPIYLARHGESVYNRQGRIGGDSSLTERGRKFKSALEKFIREPPTTEQQLQFDPSEHLAIWTSTMNRAVETVDGLPCAQTVRWKAMEELNAGDVDGVKVDEFKTKYKREYEMREAHKFSYRYPGAGGESYQDLVTRLEPVLFELERNIMPVLIVAHRGVLRCLYAYLNDIPAQDAPNISIPLHTVIKLVPSAYGTQEYRYTLTGDFSETHEAEFGI